MELQVLTVYHYGQDEKENRRLTISPSNILLVSAHTEDTVINGRTLATVNVHCGGEESFEINVTHADLERLEQAVGTYGFPD